MSVNELVIELLTDKVSYRNSAISIQLKIKNMNFFKYLDFLEFEKEIDFFHVKCHFSVFFIIIKKMVNSELKPKKSFFGKILLKFFSFKVNYETEPWGLAKKRNGDGGKAVQ